MCREPWADFDTMALTLVASHDSATIHCKFFRCYLQSDHTDCLILGTPSGHLCGNLPDASLASGPVTVKNANLSTPRVYSNQRFR